MVDTNHGRLIAALSLTPIIEMCEVSYHQEQASINALNKNISFLHGTLAAMSKRPVPASPTCVGFVRASILRKFNIFFLKHSTRTPNISSIIAQFYRQFYRHDIYRLRTEFIRAASARANARPDRLSDFFRAKNCRNIWPLHRKCVPLQSLNSTTHLIHNTLQNNV